MSQILVPGELRDTLSGLRERSSLVDDSGKVLGYFLPSESDAAPAFCQTNPSEALLADDTTSSQFAGADGRSWAEIRTDLEAGFFRFPSISDAEIQRRRQQKGGRTLAEIWARLGVQP